MSLILDALKKADADSTEGQPPGLDSDHSKRSLGDKNWQPYIVISSTFLAIAIVVLALALWPKKTEQSEQVLHITSAQPSSKPAPTQAPATASSQQTNTQSTKVNSNASRIDSMRKELVAKQYEEAKREEENKNASTKSRSEIEALYSTPEETPEPVKQAKVKTSNLQTSASPAQTVASSNTVAKVPTLQSDYALLTFINDMPYTQQKTIPTILYTSHQYQPSGASVVLNKRTVQAGQSISGSLVLEAIVSDGIVVRAGNLRFKMAALNSWINM